MRGHAHLISAYVAGSSWLHRTPLLLKFLLLAGTGVVVLALPGLLPRALVLAAVVVIHLAARLPAVRLLQPIRSMWLFLLVVLAYRWWADSAAGAAGVVAGLLACIYAANLLTATTEVQRLLDGLVAAVTPLRRFGADPERFALTIGLMLRSIPFLLGSLHDVRDAARARGLGASPRAVVQPVLIGAVAYARQTGDALAARGLGEKAAD
ncbi:cobalt transporter [Arthrobacter crystallopoietes BAB-32]|uniref:Cobalt transporter n=1 Tax=Arthrobacter crystallopoietes BAB-32 TaxID=1246476 RepID=N1V3K9_9MICC|nr:energy-coupling factor transporter transmembrane protein EcfT [Arthrobacter crystallopoietes]EMY35935.1 cobalt transporter [Arthrobacter crystallopoietes BAB-32]